MFSLLDGKLLILSYSQKETKLQFKVVTTYCRKILEILMFNKIFRILIEIKFILPNQSVFKRMIVALISHYLSLMR